MALESDRRVIGRSEVSRVFLAYSHTFARNANVWGTRRPYGVGLMISVAVAVRFEPG